MLTSNDYSVLLREAAQNFALMFGRLRDPLDLHLSDAALAQLLLDGLYVLQPEDDYAEEDRAHLQGMLEDFIDRDLLADDNGSNPE